MLKVHVTTAILSTVLVSGSISGCFTVPSPPSGAVVEALPRNVCLPLDTVVYYNALALNHDIFGTPPDTEIGGASTPILWHALSKELRISVIVDRERNGNPVPDETPTASWRQALCYVAETHGYLYQVDVSGTGVVYRLVVRRVDPIIAGLRGKRESGTVLKNSE